MDALATDTWEAVLGALELQVTRPVYETWLKDTEGVSIADQLLTVAVPTAFAVEWLERRMYHTIQQTVQQVTSQPLEVVFQVRNGVHSPAGADRSNTGPLGGSTPNTYLSSSPLSAKYTFNSFVVGPSNRLPYSAAWAVAEAPGQVYHPLFIYSGVGLGKTHLLHAIGHTCVDRRLPFLYVTCEQFTNEFVAAIRNRTTEEFRARYRKIDVLLIDDIQFIIGKEQTQEVFFHTFNDLHNSNRQVVLTSDRSPKALPLLEDRLRSRFEWGLIADIQPPDLETRMAILRNKAEQMHVSLDDNIVEHVAKKVHKNVRELEGYLNRVVALARHTSSPITMELASQAIAELGAGASTHVPDPDEVVAQVCKRMRVTREHLIGSSRKKSIVRARHVAMYLLHEDLGLKLTDIGRLFGGRDHSTVISAVSKVTYQISADPTLRHDVLAIQEEVLT